MELYTLGRDFKKVDVIDEFHSVIWTERYYGDGEIELTVPLTGEMVRKLPMGTFIALEGSKELMILETFNAKDGKVTYKGITILPWLNNRFVRTSALHQDRYWYFGGGGVLPGLMLWNIVYYMCVGTSPYLNGTIPTGIANPERLAIPGLGLRDYDKSGTAIDVGVPYMPVYAAARQIAETYEIGMSIDFDTSYGFPIGFRSYKGIDRSSRQTDYPPVRFSPQMDSLTNIEELQSVAQLKTLVYSFAPGLNPSEGDPDLRTVPGVAELADQQYTGFDLRAAQIFEDDLTTDQIGADAATLVRILNSRATDELVKSKFIQTVDGEIVPDNQFKYGVHYNLGDIVEVEGNMGTVQRARVTEFIRAQDSSGEKSYPAVSVIE